MKEHFTGLEIVSGYHKIGEPLPEHNFDRVNKFLIMNGKTEERLPINNDMLKEQIESAHLLSGRDTIQYFYLQIKEYLA